MQNTTKFLYNLDIDNKFAKSIINNNTSIFSLINPNLLTLAGLILNFYFMNTVIQKNFIHSVILITIRILIDIFDGNIARTFNKTSKFGGFLDTFSDIILVFVFSYLVTYCITKSKLKSIYFSLVIVIIQTYLFAINDSIITHDKIKELSEKNLNEFEKFTELTKIIITKNLILTLPLQFIIIFFVINKL